MEEILLTLKKLYSNNRITRQQYRTYKGQVIAGDIEGCRKGLQRKKLIQSEGN